MGVSLATTYAGTTTDGEKAPMALGTIIEATDGSRWMFVQAAEIITQYMAVGIDENCQATKLTTTNAAAGYGVGFAQVTFADNDFGWVCVHASGNINVLVKASCAADVQLYTTSTAGVLDDTSAGVTLIRGVVIVTAATTTQSTREAIAIYPNSTATP
jgi:hypothetical protein